MFHGDDVHRIETHGYVERWSTIVGRLANEDLYCRRSLARPCFSTVVRKPAVDEPSRADQQDNQCYLQREDEQAAKWTLGKHVLRLWLSFQSANKRDQGVDLVFFQFLPEGRHVAAHVAAVHDRVEDTFVADVRLPVRVCKIARVAVLAFRSF